MKSIEFSVPVDNNTVVESNIYKSIYRKYLSHVVNKKMSEEEFEKIINDSKISEMTIKSTVMGLIKTGMLFEVINGYVEKSEEVSNKINGCNVVKVAEEDFLIFETEDNLLDYLENNDFEGKKMAIKMTSFIASDVFEDDILDRCLDIVYEKTGEVCRFSVQYLKPIGHYYSLCVKHVKKKN